ncbi:MAG: site-specific integrase [Deltaproteobacteria bacterium]|nr:site-specific integrase [Deltaproteobacteria bacterium]
MANIEKRISKTGVVSYRALVRLKGYPRQSATFARLTDARRWAQKTEADIREGRYFPTTMAKKRTVGEMIERYRRDVLHQKKKSSAVSQDKQLIFWANELGEYTLDRVTPALLAEYRDRLLSEDTNRGGRRTAGTVTRYMASLSHVFTVAMKEWQWIDDNPFRRVIKPKQSRGVVRFLSDDERAALLKACKESSNGDLYCAVVVAISTGCRRGELWNLKWDHVDLKRGLLIFEDTKNGERRNVPLVGHALEVMKERRESRTVLPMSNDYVFPGKVPGQPMDLTRPWREAMVTADIKNFRWHDLRHSCASYLAMNGATLAEIAEVLGHKTLQMVKRYAHLSEAHTSKVVASMTDKIFSQETTS